MTIGTKFMKKGDLEDPMAEIRIRFLLEVKAAYMEHYEEGLVDPNSLILLNNSINEGLDRADIGLHDWKFLSDLVQYGFLLKLGIKLQRFCCIGPLVHRWVYQEVKMIYDVFQNYTVCSNHALHLLMEMTSVDQTIIQNVADELKKNLDEARNELINLRSGYPNLMRDVDKQHCEYYVLRQFTKHYRTLAQSGQIDQKHEGLIQEELDMKMKALKLTTHIRKLDPKEQAVSS